MIVHAEKEPLGRETDAAVLGITERAGKNWINNKLALKKRVRAKAQIRVSPRFCVTWTNSA